MQRRRKTVYLHVGPPKTGTTYLQDILQRNRALLRSRGLLVPGSRLVEHFHAALDLRGIRFGGHDSPEVPGAWDRLAGQARDANCDAVVITHEILAGARPDEISRAVESLAPADVHIVYGARDLARQLPAVWQESLKNRRTRTYDAFLSAALKNRAQLVQSSRPTGEPVGFWRAQDPVATLARWSVAVSPEQITVVTLPQADAAASTLWERFSKALEVDSTGCDLAVARTNGSLTAADAEVLRRLNTVLPDDLDWPTYEHEVKRRFNARANARSLDGGSRLTVPEQYRPAVVERAEQIRAQLAAAAYRVVGDLDDLLPLPASFGAPEQVPPDKVTEAAVDVLAGVLAEAAGPARADTRGGGLTARAVLGRLRRG